jgi:hypothetical protein
MLLGLADVEPVGVEINLPPHATRELTELDASSGQSPPRTTTS